MMRKRPSSRANNSSSVVVFEDPSSKSGSSSSDSGGNVRRNRKRVRPGLLGNNQDSNSGSDRFSNRSISSDVYGVLCCKNCCTTKSQSWVYTFVIILLGGAACISVLVLGLQFAQQSSQELFQDQATEIVFSLTRTWREYETLLLWIHESCDLIADANVTTAGEGSPERISEQIGFCSRQDFSYLTRHLDSLQLQVVSIQFAPNITHAQRPQLEQESRLYYQDLPSVSNSSTGRSYPYLGITNISFDGSTGSILERIPAPEKPIYFPAHYVHPLNKYDDWNTAIIEMDLYGIPAIREDIDKAFGESRPVMGDRFRIHSETNSSDTSARLWAVGVVHPGIDERNPVDAATTQEEQPYHGSRHRSISRVVLWPVELIESSISSLDFPNEGGASIYIFDDTVDDDHEASPEPTFLAGLNRFDDGFTEYLDEIPYSDLDDFGRYSFQNARIYQETVTVTDHRWVIVVIPNGNAYIPSFDFVILGSLLLFLATIVVTCLHHRSMARAGEMRSLKSEQTREKAKNALLQAQRERHLNDFIAHEVRNPLASALAALSFIQESVEQVSDASTRQSLSNDVTTVQNSLDYIDDLLRNMLDIHRTAEQDFAMRYSMTNIKNGLLSPVKDMASTRNAIKNVQFRVECSSKIWAEVDPLRVEQILLNLAMDAAKYVDEGGFVRFRADVVNGQVRLYVEDSGPGIAVENRDKLFQRYYQSLGVVFQGTGVGVHICKTLINLMGAKIWLDDSYDSGIPGCPGSRFVIDLNRPSMNRCNLSPTGFCDGNCDCQEIADPKTTGKEPSTSIPFHHDCSEVDFSPVVEDSARTTADITSDDRDPSGSTGDFLLDLEAGLASGATLQLCTGKEPSLEAGAGSALAASGDFSSVSSKQSRSIEQGKEEDSLPDRLSVLFVDDDKTLRKLFCRSAKRLHDSWKVAEAHNGETALQMVKDDHYDLIFMDQYMESTSKQLLGTEVVRAMRDSKLVDENTTICGLSANEEKERFLSAGADYFLLKPISCSKEALKEQIMCVLRETAEHRATETKDDIDVVNSGTESRHRRCSTDPS